MPTTPRQFRLPDATLEDLAYIATRLAELVGRSCNRTDAVIYAAKSTAGRLARLDPARKKSGKKS